MTTELAFIESLRQLAADPGARGFDDDCAVLEIGGEALVFTHDMMAENVHYLADQDPADVAWKLVSVNISDLAAKGAKPLGVLLGYMLGGDDNRFISGLKDALEHYRTPLLGGDTISGKGPKALGLTAIGRAVHQPVPSRSGAREGDALYVTGALGAAMMGYEAFKAGKGEAGAYLRPDARLAEGIALAPHVTAMMDISDGLLLDATRMAKASGLSLAIDSGAVPIAVPEPRRQDALRWGDDYELLFTLPPDIDPPVEATHIGQAIATSSAPVLLDGYAMRDTASLGYQH